MTSRIILFMLLFSATLPNISFAAKYSCPSTREGSEHGNQGARYWSNGLHDLAERETRIALQNDPECSMWYQNLGFILESQGKIDESIQSLRKSLEVNNDWCTSTKTGSHMKLGMLYYKKRNYELSIEYFLKAISTGQSERLDPLTMSQIYLYLSYNFTESEGDGAKHYNLKSAEDLTKKALDLTPEEVPVKFSLAKILALKNNRKEAESLLENIIKIQEESSKPTPYAYAYSAFIFSILKNSAKSAAYIEKAIDLNPDYSKYLLDELDKDFKNVSSSKEMAPIIAKAKKLAQ